MLWEENCDAAILVRPPFMLFRGRGAHLLYCLMGDICPVGPRFQEQKGGLESISKGREPELSGCLLVEEGGTRKEISKSQDN